MEGEGKCECSTMQENASVQFGVGGRGDPVGDLLIPSIFVTRPDPKEEEPDDR